MSAKQNIVNILKVVPLFAFVFPAAFPVYAQDARIKDDFLMTANVMQSIIVESTANFDVDFASDVTSSLNYVDASDSERKLQGPDTGPAQLKIRGAPAMAMVEVEVDQISSPNENDNVDVNIYEFDIGEKEAGNSVTIMPFSEEDVIVLGIGAKAEGRNSTNGQYIGINVVNVNYL